MMDDLIRRQDAIDAVGEIHPLDYNAQAIKAKIEKLPSAQPEPNYDEWCDDCKEYDHEKHCCPRWNRVIRETLKDAQPERKTENALRLLLEWAIECGFGYDNIPEEYERYKDDIEGMSYTDGLIYIAKMEVEHE